MIIKKTSSQSIRTVSILVLSLILSLCFCQNNGNNDKPVPIHIWDEYINFPGYWNDGMWIALMPAYSSDVFSLVISSSDVYAGGYSVNSSRISVPGYWMNGVWTALPYDGYSAGGCVNTLFISVPDVYASGYNTNIYPQYCFWPLCL
jgi:hypothetical protein